MRREDQFRDQRARHGWWVTAVGEEGTAVAPPTHPSVYLFSARSPWKRGCRAPGGAAPEVDDVTPPPRVAVRRLCSTSFVDRAWHEEKAVAGQPLQPDTRAPKARRRKRRGEERRGRPTRGVRDGPQVTHRRCIQE